MAKKFIFINERGEDVLLSFLSIPKTAKKITALSPDSVDKHIREYLKSSYQHMDMDLSQLMGGKPYKLSDEVVEYFEDAYNNKGGIPTETMLKQAFDYSSELAADATVIAADVAASNFSDDTYNKVSKKIKASIKKIKESHFRGEEKLNDITFKCIAMEDIMFVDIEAFVLEVGRVYQEPDVKDDANRFTERDIRLINFMRLPKLLSDLHKKLTKERTADMITEIIQYHKKL